MTQLILSVVGSILIAVGAFVFGSMVMTTGESDDLRILLVPLAFILVGGAAIVAAGS